MTENYTNIQTYNIPPESERSLAPQVQMKAGGVMQYDLPCQTSDIPRTYNSIQANVGGTTTWTPGGGVQHSGGTQTFNMAEVAADNGGDFLATARNGFFPAAGNLKADTVVTYQGMEVELGTLAALGVVKRNGDSYEIASAAGNNQQPQSAQQATPQNSLPEGVEHFSPAIEAQVAQAIDPFPQPLYDAAIARALEKGIDAVDFHDLAYHSGMTPAEARQRAGVVMNAFSQQSDGIVKASGIANPAELYEWAARERKDELASARRELAFGRSTKALKALAADYFTSEPPSVETLKGAGIPVRFSSTGEVVALIRGNWMTPAAAAKAGLI